MDWTTLGIICVALVLVAAMAVAAHPRAGREGFTWSQTCPPAGSSVPDPGCPATHPHKLEFSPGQYYCYSERNVSSAVCSCACPGCNPNETPCVAPTPCTGDPSQVGLTLKDPAAGMKNSNALFDGRAVDVESDTSGLPQGAAGSGDYGTCTVPVLPPGTEPACGTGFERAGAGGDGYGLPSGIGAGGAPSTCVVGVNLTAAAPPTFTYELDGSGDPTTVPRTSRGAFYQDRKIDSECYELPGSESGSAGCAPAPTLADAIASSTSTCGYGCKPDYTVSDLAAGWAFGPDAGKVGWAMQCQSPVDAPGPAKLYSSPAYSPNRRDASATDSTAAGVTIHADFPRLDREDVQGLVAFGPDPAKGCQAGCPDVPYPWEYPEGVMGCDRLAGAKHWDFGMWAKNKATVAGTDEIAKNKLAIDSAHDIIGIGNSLTPVQPLLEGESCDVKCSPGWSPANAATANKSLTCQGGQLDLQSIDLKCDCDGCPLDPGDSGAAALAPADVSGCTQAQINGTEPIPCGQDCYVKCAPGYEVQKGHTEMMPGNNPTAMDLYWKASCSMHSNSLTGEGTNNRISGRCYTIGYDTPCKLPDFKDLGLVAGDCADGCSSGASLEPDRGCCAKCAPGYVQTGHNDATTFPGSRDAGGEYSFWCQDGKLHTSSLKCIKPGCTLPASLGANVVPGQTDPCTPGQEIDPSKPCNVQCAPGYKPDQGTTQYACKDGNLAPASLKCTTEGCTLPASLGSNVVPGQTDPCAPGKEIDPSKPCNVQCAPGYQPDQGTTQYTCKDGKLAPASLKCTTEGCTLPASLGSNVVPGQTDPCAPGQKLDPSKPCNVQCAPGYQPDQGTAQYTCKDGKLAPASLKCTAKACTIPASLGTGVTGGGEKACSASQTLPGGESCSVGCKKGFKQKGGSTEYSCSNGKLSPATLACEPVSCEVAADLGRGVRGIGSNPCIAGASLSAGQNCDVGCKDGYRSKGGTTSYQCPDNGETLPASLQCGRVSCPLPHSFGEGITQGGTAPCEPGGTILGGQQCSVKCGAGYTAVGGNPSYVCGQTGALNKATLSCARTKCPVPASFGEGRVPGGETPCEAGGTVDSGDSCSVQCGAGYKPVSGNSEYMCDQRGMLSDATLQCEQISCDIPSDFGNGVMGTGESPCDPGMALIAGESCHVKCENGYDMVGEEVNYARGGTKQTFHCSKAGFLTEPGIKCRETRIRPYNSVWAIDFGGVLG